MSLLSTSALVAPISALNVHSGLSSSEGSSLREIGSGYLIASSQSPRSEDVIRNLRDQEIEFTNYLGNISVYTENGSVIASVRNGTTLHEIFFDDAGRIKYLQTVEVTKQNDRIPQAYDGPATSQVLGAIRQYLYPLSLGPQLNRISTGIGMMSVTREHGSYVVTLEDPRDSSLRHEYFFATNGSFTASQTVNVGRNGTQRIIVDNAERPAHTTVLWNLQIGRPFS